MIASLPVVVMELSILGIDWLGSESNNFPSMLLVSLHWLLIQLVKC